MVQFEGLSKPFKCDYEGLIANILRKGQPKRVYHMELFQDEEIKQAIADKFDLAAGLDSSAADFELRKYINVQRFCGFDYVRAGMDDFEFPLHKTAIDDTSDDLAKAGGRVYQDEHTGPIMSWEDFEKYPWPNPDRDECTATLEWFEKNLPDDMCVIGSGGIGHFAEYISWLMGYETLCFALFDQKDLVKAISDKLREIYSAVLKRILQFDRVKMIWSSDDMGFKTGLMISPDDTRELVLTGHKDLAELSHAAGRPYLLHSCGNLCDIMEDLIENVKIDAKHSFEDTIEDVCEVKKLYGDRIALIGGIDVDFLCRKSPDEIRQRVRNTLDVCQAGGGYALGTGNTPANYVPLDNYLTMIDEGMLYQG